MFKKIFALSIVVMCWRVNGELADDFKPCKYGDSECIKTTIEFLFKEKSQGFDSINLAKLSPLKYKKVHLHQSAQSPVSLELILKNQSIYGLDRAKVIKVKGFGKDLTMKHSLKIRADSLTTTGDYDVNGKILILPIVGSGTLNITFVDVVLFINFVGKPLEKDGATYMDIEHLNLNAEPKRIVFRVTNLFNGDKALGDNMNYFLNENWLEIYNEIRASLAQEFGEVFRNVIKSVFNKYPYEKYFTD